MKRQVQAPSEPDVIAQTISKFQDKIQETKFQLARLKIELGFRVIMKVFQKKQKIIQIFFFQRLKHLSVKKIVTCIKEPINKLFDNLDRIRQRNTLKAFIKLKFVTQRPQSSQSSIRKVTSFKSPNRLHGSKLKITSSQANSNGQQMSSQQIEQECQFLKVQIKKIEKSFQDFYDNLQKN